MKNRVLIVYYTHSGNTEKIAELIQKKTGGDILKLEPEKKYPTSYVLVVAQVKLEIVKGFSPELKSDVPNLENYDIIFIGTPNWWSTMAPPVKTFLEKYDLTGKKIIPFYTHGGGGGGHIVKDIKKLCPHLQLLKELGVYEQGDSQTEDIISNWIKENIGIKSSIEAL